MEVQETIPLLKTFSETWSSHEQKVLQLYPGGGKEIKDSEAEREEAGLVREGERAIGFGFVGAGAIMEDEKGGGAQDTRMVRR